MSRVEITDKFDSFNEAVEYVFNIPKFTAKNDLETTREFYEYLGCPGERIKTVHVAGTNGKGSTCNYLSDILKGHGYSVGFFSSPHLVSVCERFRINDVLMSEAEFVSSLESVMKKVCEWRRGGRDYHPTFFEILFFMGMIWFEANTPDYIILETGLGGRLDATNIVKKPELTVITRIGLDHTEYLGDTIEQIAGEKAGIIKPGVPLVYWNTNDTTDSVFEKRAAECGAKTLRVGYGDIDNIRQNEKSIDFCLTYGYDKNGYGRKMQIKLPTVALYQTENASLALNASHMLLGTSLNEKDSAECLWCSFWEGRMQEIRPGFYVDGAHNRNGTEAFLDTLKDMNVKGATLLFGANKDKDYAPMIKMLAESGFFTETVVTTLEGTRSQKAEVLRDEFIRCGMMNVTVTDSVSQAFEMLYDSGKLIFAAGSLYLVGEIMEETR